MAMQKMSEPRIKAAKMNGGCQGRTNTSAPPVAIKVIQEVFIEGPPLPCTPPRPWPNGVVMALQIVSFVCLSWDPDGCQEDEGRQGHANTY